MLRKLILISIGLSFLSLISFSGWASAIDRKSYQKTGVTQDKADSEVQTASIVLGLNLNSFSLGEDPCTREAKHRFSPKSSKYGDISLGKLPRKPSVQIGRGGQAMEGGSETAGGSDVYPAETSSENVCLEGYDGDGNKCVEATQNPDGSITLKNISDTGCTIQFRDARVKLAPNSEITINPPKEKSAGEKILHEIGKAFKWTRQVVHDMFFPPEKEPPSRKTPIAGIRGQCDPYGVTGGCRVDKGSAVVLPSWLNPNEIEEAVKNGWVKELVWRRVNPRPDSNVNPPGGPTPSKTYPGESTKSGFEKEKESKVSKGGQITNPSGEKGTGHPAGFDFCGKHLPSPEEYARMAFDPGRITDPVDKSWNGRIEQIQNQRSLTWSKSLRRSDGFLVKVERKYQNGSLVSSSYQFFDRKGEIIGVINYDAVNGKVEGQRLK